MNKPGRIGLLAALLAPGFAAVVAIATHFKLSWLFLLGWIGGVLCVLVGIVAVFSAIILQLQSNRSH